MSLEQTLVQWISSLIGNEVLVAFVLGMTPFVEISVAALYAFSVGKPWLILVAIVSNFAIVPVLLLVWNALDLHRWGRRILGARLDRRVHDLGRKYETWGVLGLTIFVGIPGPGTGVYTGTLVAKILGIGKRQILTASLLGVLLSAAIMYAALSGLVALRV